MLFNGYYEFDLHSTPTFHIKYCIYVIQLKSSSFSPLHRRVKDVQRQVILHDDLSLAVDYTGESCLRADATLHRARECDNIFIGRKMSYHGMDSIPAPMNLIPTQDQDDSSNSPQVSISDKELIMGDQDTNDTTRQIATPTVREIKLQHADTMASDSQV